MAGRGHKRLESSRWRYQRRRPSSTSQVFDAQQLRLNLWMRLTMNSLPLGIIRVGLCVLIVSCSTPQTKPDKHLAALHSDGPDLQTLQFKSGLPGIGDHLHQSLLLPDIADEQLRENLQLIERIGSESFKVIGSTDDVECVESECPALAKRRAIAVIDWLVRRGIPRSRLIPVARGPYMGLTDTPYTEAERRISRRVEIEIELTDADKR